MPPDYRGDSTRRPITVTVASGAQFQAVNHIYNGPDWSKDIITPQNKFLSDVTGGKLRAVSWVTPTCGNSDHAGCGNNTGPSWVSSIVNTIGESQYWNNTASASSFGTITAAGTTLKRRPSLITMVWACAFRC